MPLSYNQSFSIDHSIADLYAISVWRHSVMRACFFPGQFPNVEAAFPSATIHWAMEQAEKGAIDQAESDRLLAAYGQVVRIAEPLLKQAMAGTAIKPEEYDDFENACVACAMEIMNFEKRRIAAASPLEAQMSLRPSRELRNDVKREQDRFDRKGTSFSVAAIELDDIETLRAKYSVEQVDTIFIHLSRLLTRTVRSFDDAYYLGDGVFILMLKHIEFMDACAVMDRLREEVAKTEVELEGGEKVSITASFGVCEAMQKEPSDRTIEFAKAALEEAKELGGNRVAEHQELSSLAKYVRENHQD